MIIGIMSSNRTFLIVSLIFAILSIVGCDSETDEISFNFKPCEENNLDECFRNIMELSLLEYKNGNEALGIPPLEPLEVSKQKGNYSGVNGIEVSIVVENTKIYGLTDVKIEKMRTSINEKGLRAVMEVYLPRVEATGNYKANIKLNDFKIRPKGIFNVIISDSHNINKVTAEFENIDGKKFLNIKNVTIDPTIGEIKFNATGIFDDPALNEVAVQLANRYLPNFYKLIIQESQFVWEPLIVAASNNFFKRVSFDKFFISESKN
ncbi:uncharacterized protein LOC129612483 [Condylostylus longicornis]|uniref:uncharacterized protein LOC129612483 n=1 Tax=Condylostylus longicornis TaxID=2530218 RepID=UPI00244E2448|nr:uncharacterized protein LOC129612483 [Condylostylus longicornis]